MNTLEILNVLTDYNFWKQELATGIRRERPLAEIKAALRGGEIIVITGIRRCGKSTVLLQFCRELLNQGVRKENILIINFEDPRYGKMDLPQLNALYETYLTELNPVGKQYIVLDEVQVVEGWERFARYLQEIKKASVFVTGSSSKLLSSEYSTVLAGRHRDIAMTPLSFREFLTFKDIHVTTNLDLTTQRHALRRACSDYLRWGGFPKVILIAPEKERRELLEMYFRDIIVKDAVTRYHIKDIPAFEELAKYYLTNISSLHSFNRVRKFLKLNLDTVERYSHYLFSVYLLAFVPKFSYSQKEQIVNPRKVYCLDVGLRNTTAFVFSEDWGKLAENIVFNELARKNKEVYYWKGIGEVDFIAKQGSRIQSVVQVCWQITDPQTKQREIKALLEGMKRLKQKKGLIITEDFTSEEHVGGVHISYIPLWRWLLQ